MIVTPFTVARTSRRRLTLLKILRAWAIRSLSMPEFAASAAAAVAFHTLYSPPSENSNSAHFFPLRNTVHLVRVGSRDRSVICHSARDECPYRSTGQNARLR